MPPNTPSPSNQTPPPTYQPAGPVLPPPAPHRDRHHREGIKSVISTILILLIAPILALAITAFVFQSYEVEGPSMEPTLETQDRLIIWKAGRTWARITKEDFLPKRGTVVVFVKKGMYDFDGKKEKQLIKRVIALPGDRIVVQDGLMTVYNDKNPDGFNPDEALPYGKDIQELTEGKIDTVIAPGEVFVVGDNRDNSLDSRSFGPIPAVDIVGTLSLRILPLSEAERF